MKLELFKKYRGHSKFKFLRTLDKLKTLYKTFSYVDIYVDKKHENILCICEEFTITDKAQVINIERGIADNRTPEARTIRMLLNEFEIPVHKNDNT